ncbi:hypothetical protein CDAR_286611 [Caerostris darwini]|uniref:Uncharacterized protein n=1 Tax=Caerostris darwini TaxID=1538125 RepID=A0AAV4UTB4_9ARAC|nr:hypothetical protein CDAR_286611 [Caerostris darwini]
MISSYDFHRNLFLLCYIRTWKFPLWSENHPFQKSSDGDNDDLYCCPAIREDDFKIPLSQNPFRSVMFDLGSFHSEPRTTPSENRLAPRERARSQWPPGGMRGQQVETGSGMLEKSFARTGARGELSHSGGVRKAMTRPHGMTPAGRRRGLRKEELSNNG